MLNPMQSALAPNFPLRVKIRGEATVNVVRFEHPGRYTVRRLSAPTPRGPEIEFELDFFNSKEIFWTRRGRPEGVGRIEKLML